jgi:hypothetical protein
MLTGDLFGHHKLRQLQLGGPPGRRIASEETFAQIAKPSKSGSLDMPLPETMSFGRFYF